MSSSENWTSRCGRGRARLSHKSQINSAPGSSFQQTGAGDGHFCPSKNTCSPNDASQFGYQRLAEPSKTDPCAESSDNSSRRKSLTSRTKTKKPEVQVYVPPAKRSQQQQPQQQPEQAHQDDLKDKDDTEHVKQYACSDTGSVPHLKDTAVDEAGKCIEKTTPRKKSRPEIKRYVPKGKREINILVQDVSSNDKERDSKGEKTEKQSTRTRPVKKLKICESNEDHSGSDPNSENTKNNLSECVTGRNIDLENVEEPQETLMETESWSDEAVNMQLKSVTCPDSNSFSNNQFSSTTINNYSKNLLTQDNKISSETVDDSPNLSGFTDVDDQSHRVYNLGPIDSTTCSKPHAKKLELTERPSSETNVSEYLQDHFGTYTSDSTQGCSKSESFSSEYTLQTANSDEEKSVQSNNDVSSMTKSHPNVYQDVIEYKQTLDNSDPVDCEEHTFTSSVNESSLDISSERELANELHTDNNNSPNLSAWRSPPETENTDPVVHSLSLPDVVASTIEAKSDQCPAESKSDKESNSHQSVGGGTLTSLALKQLENVGSQSDDEDGWDALFDDNGDCLDPTIMEELTAHVGDVKIDTPKINYLKFEPKESDLDMEAYNHVIEIYDFPSEFTTRDLIGVFKDFMSRGFDIKWVDDTHALGVFANPIAARDALQMMSPFLKVRQLSEASKQSKLKAKKCSEFLQPYKARPQTSAVAARRLVSGALGIQASIPREKRELERKQLKEAKEKRKQARQQKQDIWDGSLGKCAMDEES